MPGQAMWLAGAQEQGNQQREVHIDARGIPFIVGGLVRLRLGELRDEGHLS